MAAYRRVYDSRHVQADCQEPGSAREPHARQSNMGCLYLFHLGCEILAGADYHVLHDSISIGSAVSAGLTILTNRQTDTQTTLLLQQ